MYGVVKSHTYGSKKTELTMRDISHESSFRLEQIALVFEFLADDKIKGQKEESRKENDTNGSNSSNHRIAGFEYFVEFIGRVYFQCIRKRICCVKIWVGEGGRATEFIVRVVMQISIA